MYLLKKKYFCAKSKDVTTSRIFLKVHSFMSETLQLLSLQKEDFSKNKSSSFYSFLNKLMFSKDANIEGKNKFFRRYNSNAHKYT